MLQNFYVAFNETSAQILSLTAFGNSKSLKINLLFFLQDKMLQQQEIHKQFPIFLQLFQSPYQILGVGMPLIHFYKLIELLFLKIVPCLCQQRCLVKKMMEIAITLMMESQKL